MANYQEAKKSYTNKCTIKQTKICSKSKTGTILTINKKNLENEELSHELFLTIRQTNKIINDFANNMSIDIKFSKAQISKIIQRDGSFGSLLANLGKKALINAAILLPKDDIPVSEQFNFKCNK